MRTLEEITDMLKGSMYFAVFNSTNSFFHVPLDCKIRCVEHNLHLNPEKIRINVDSVPFFGQTLMNDGLQMDANKWQGIQNWPQPKEC